MEIVVRFLDKVAYLLKKRLQPEMIGYSIWNGVKKKNLRISNTCHVSSKGNVIFGDNCFVGHFNVIDGSNNVVFGDGVQVTNYVTISTHSSHNAIRFLGESYCNDFSESDTLLRGSVHIGEYSYIGPHCVISPGVTIGKGCIISAFSFINSDVPDYSIVRGQPGVIVGDTKSRDKQLLNEDASLRKTYYLKDV